MKLPWLRLSFVSLTAALIMTACATLTPEQRSAALQQNATNAAQVEAAKAAAETKLTTASADEAKKLKQELEAYKVALTALQAQRAGLEAPGAGFNWGAAGASAIPYLPFPFNLIVGLGLAGVAGVQTVRAKTNENAAVSLVNATNVARDADPVVPKVMSENKVAINAVLTPTAKKLVDRHRKS